jgi:hypothetical protein
MSKLWNEGYQPAGVREAGVLFLQKWRDDKIRGGPPARLIARLLDYVLRSYGAKLMDTLTLRLSSATNFSLPSILYSPEAPNR